MPDDKLTPQEFAAIDGHLRPLVIAATNAIERLCKIPKSARNEQLANQIKYWENARSALNWALGIAKQRCARPKNVV